MNLHMTAGKSLNISEQEDFFNEVERVVAEHRKKDIIPEIPGIKREQREHCAFLSALEELNTFPKEELQKRWTEIQKKNGNK